MFEGLLALLKTYHTSIAMCSFTQNLHSAIENKHPKSSPKKQIPEGVVTAEEAIQKIILSVDPVFCGSLWNKLFSADLFNSPPLIRLDQRIHRAEDYLAVIQCMLKTTKAAYTVQSYYFYRQCESSAMHHLSLKSFTTFYVDEKLIYHVLPSTLSELAKAACARVSSRLICAAYASYEIKHSKAFKFVKRLRKRYLPAFRKSRKLFSYQDRLCVFGTGRFSPVFCRLWNLLKAIRSRRDACG